MRQRLITKLRNLNLTVNPPVFFSLFTKKKYSKETLRSDLIAGLIVGIVALPLAIAFGIASGVTPQQGLITAIVAGFIISFLGGSNFLIGGPTGAFIVIVYGIIQQYGFGGLMTATIMAGIMLVLMGVFKLGGIIKFIPYPIIVGFTTGIAVVIFSTQLKDFFGFPIDTLPAGFTAQWIYYIKHLGKINLLEAGLAIACLSIIILWPKTSKVPGSLIAIIFGTVVSVVITYFPSIQLATIGTKFPELAKGLSFPSPQLPDLSFNTIKNLFSPAFTIAMLCAIESLLAAMVADGVTGKKHDSNTELVGQGVANIITPIFGGIPATGAIARTMTNINNGGKTPLVGIIHAVVLLLIYLFLMPYAVYIPLSCLAAVLVMVAYNMSEWRTFKQLLKGERGDVAVLLITFFLTVLIDLTVAIQVGLVLAVVSFIKRVSDTSDIKVLKDNVISATEDAEKAQLTDTDRLSVPKGVEVYEIDGPFFFGLASKLDEVERATRKDIIVRIIRMRKVPFIDSTGINHLNNLITRSKREGITIVLSGVTSRVRGSLDKSNTTDIIGKENIFSHIIPALARASEIVANAPQKPTKK